MNKWMMGAVCTLLSAAAACERLDDRREDYLEEPPATRRISLEEVARLLGGLSLEEAQLGEVYDAVASSEENGYDSEYRMAEIFSSPGQGVGADPAQTKAYSYPLRELLREAVYQLSGTKDGLGGPDPENGLGGMDPEAYIEALSSSDAQIYWPFSERWDGSCTPVVTFDPGDNSEKNIGYVRAADGTVTELIVSEDLARERPVWVVNWNDDAAYRSLEILRREDPSWGSGGGEILVKSGSGASDDVRTLVLRSFKANRNYDSWFAGASEFFCKCGAVESFRASTEAELQLYNPSITDFMIVVRRNQVGQEIPFNAVLVSEWTEKLTNCAFMMTEDDGGTQTSWKCSAVVKYNSKSYGFEIEIPLRTRDDIVWRGSLSRNYIEKYNGLPGHFGDVDLVLELI